MSSSFPQQHEPGDVFKDEKGQLWVVTAFTASPTVEMKRVWPVYGPYANASTHGEETKRGGVLGLMWEGFTKLEPKP